MWKRKKMEKWRDYLLFLHLSRSEKRDSLWPAHKEREKKNKNHLHVRLCNEVTMTWLYIKLGGFSARCRGHEEGI
jgi:hypothetical protein